MSVVSRSPLITVMSNAAIKAGKGLLRDFSEVEQLQVSKKGTANFVTAADIRTEKFLFRELQKARPTFGFLMEESGEVQGEDAAMRWIIDPLDGTTNFIHAVPYFCISIALEKKISPTKYEILAGVIYDPIHNELFAAEKYKGAYLNDRRIMVSGRRELDESLLATAAPRQSRAGYARSKKILKAVTAQDIGVRCNGAAALDLAYVAAGRYEGCWFTSLQPWDLAAGMLLVEEAGGKVTELDGEPNALKTGNIFASNAQLHTKLHGLIQAA